MELAVVPAPDAPVSVSPQPPPRWLIRLATPVMRGLLRSPLASRMGDGLVLLEFTGRRSGRAYALPVVAVRVGDDLLAATDKGWKANLRGGASLSVRIGGQRLPAVAEVIDDPVAMADRYEVMVATNPQFARIVGLRIDRHGRPLAADVERAAAAGHVVLVLRLSAA